MQNEYQFNQRYGDNHLNQNMQFPVFMPKINDGSRIKE
jgi:hypothetical protein